MITSDNTLALILAGGRSSRMGGAKKQALVLGGEPLLSRVIRLISSQIPEVIINLNEKPQGIDLAGFTIVPDVNDGYPGPLAGLVSAFEYLEKNARPAEAILLVPCDGPFLPPDLAHRLITALNENRADVACASYGQEPQPTFSLWTRPAVARAAGIFYDTGKGGFKFVLQRLDTVYVQWRKMPVNPFFNINTQQDLALARQISESVSP